jgi:hypothetical protein
MPKRSRSDSPSSTTSLHEEVIIRGRSTSPIPKYSRTTSLEPRSMFCTLPPHDTLQLDSNDFEAHYSKEHTNRCTACSANLPSAHMLELHIGELHDPLVAARREKGEKTVQESPTGAQRVLTESQYRCFVETCDRACSAPKKRRLHMIDKHQYPRDYDFWVVENGIESGRTSLLQRARTRSNEDRQEVGRKRGGLGKMIGRQARTQSSSVAKQNTRIVFDREEADEVTVDSLTSKLGTMGLSLTPRSVMLKKNRN